jgi:hypothetical protein
MLLRCYYYFLCSLSFVTSGTFQVSYGLILLYQALSLPDSCLSVSRCHGFTRGRIKKIHIQLQNNTLCAVLYAKDEHSPAKKGFTSRVSAASAFTSQHINLKVTTGMITEPEIDSAHWVRGTHFVPASLYGSSCSRRHD